MSYVAFRRALAVCALALAALASPALAQGPPTLDLERLTGLQAQQMMNEGKLTSVGLTQAYIDRITALNKRGPGLNAVTQYNRDALVEAAASDARRKAGQLLGPADGLPILMKDLVDVKGMYTSAGNFSLRDSYPANDSGIARNLKKAGVVILGKLGLTEYANSFGRQPQGFGNLTGQVLNGLDTDATPIGSSSGTGTASNVALATLNIGTETSGSNIAPAVIQGTVSIRPTVGLVPGIGVGPISGSQDTAGPAGKTVEDTALTLTAMAGYDQADVESRAGIWGPGVSGEFVVPTAPRPNPDYMSALDPNFVRGKRIGYNGDISAGTPLRAAYDALAAAGAILVERPIIDVTQPAGVTAYDQHRDLDRYYANLGPDAPIKSLEEEIADNRANAHEALKFGNSSHSSAFDIDISENSAASVIYRADLVQGKIVARGAIDSMLQNNTPSDPSDDFVAILGRVYTGTDQYGHALGSRAGYPQITVPMGYDTNKRAPLNVLVHGTKFTERTLLGVGYVIEQATKRHRPASELSPSIYRCTATVPAPPHADRGSCNPAYDEIMNAIGTRPALGFSLETESVKSLDERLLEGTLTSETLTKAYLARIALTNAEGPATQAVRSVDLGAIAQAKALDAERAAHGPRGPLHGIPVLIADSVDVAGTPTTAGSIALQKSTPAADAKLVARLRAAGAIILGKTNVSELNGVFDANMPEGFSSLGGQVLMASDTDKTVVGSSAGSATATASGLAALTIGLETSTDTAQLIGPASVAGVVGLKPTVGRISRAGVLGVAKSQDAPGPITRTVADAAIALQYLAVKDPADSATSGAPQAPDYAAALKTNALRGKRVTVVTSTDVPYGEALTTLGDLGATAVVKTVGTPVPNPASIVTREFKRDLNAYLAGTSGDAAKSLDAIVAYNSAHADEALHYQQRDLLAAAQINLSDPATASAYASDRDSGRAGARALIDDLLGGNLPDASSVIMVPQGNALIGIADRAGYPTLTVPAGYGVDNAGRNPIGVTFIGTAYDEADLLAAGYAFEQAKPARLAPSWTNPSMWRCVPGSTFFSPHHCNPGDRLYTQQFTPVPSKPATPAAPEGETPSVVSELPSIAPVSVAGPPAPGASPLPQTIRLATAAVRADRLGRFTVKVSCATGTGNCRASVRVQRSGRSLAARSVTIRPGASTAVRVRASAAMRRTLQRGRAVTVRVSVTGTGIRGVKPVNVKVLPRR